MFLGLGPRLANCGASLKHILAKIHLQMRASVGCHARPGHVMLRHVMQYGCCMFSYHRLAVVFVDWLVAVGLLGWLVVLLVWSLCLYACASDQPTAL